MIKNLLSRLKTDMQACVRPLVLDMDWYRWDLGPFWKKLPSGVIFSIDIIFYGIGNITDLHAVISI